MMPSMSLQMSASSSAKGGEFGVTNNLMSTGDWVINNGNGSAAGGGMSQEMMYLLAAGLGLWAILKFKRRI